MWVTFTRDYDYEPHPRAVIAYKAGMHLNVPKAAGEAALAAGAASQAKNPRLKQGEVDREDDGPIEPVDDPANPGGATPGETAPTE